MGSHCPIIGACITRSTSRPAWSQPTAIPPAVRAWFDLVPQGSEHLFAVGRLDLSSEGLILVTNDGDLANRLTHPRYEVPKTYRMLVAGQPSREQLEQLRRGVRIAEGMARVRELRPIKRHKQSTLLEIVLQEGHNREIRRILASVGHKVMRLQRIAVGPIRLGKLPPGASRRLTREEIEALKKSCRTQRPAAGDR